MGDIINLRIERKRRARANAAVTAQANRAKYGRTTAEKAADAAQTDRAARHMDGARRERDEL